MFRTLERLLFPVLNALGPLLIILALAQLVPIGIAFREGENVLNEFFTSAAISLFCGLLFLLSTRRFRRELEPRDGFLLVTLSWFSAVLFGSLPLALLLPEIPYYRIFFEAVSCLTTTGATAINNLNELPLSLNYWRCLLSWLGGMGIIVNLDVMMAKRKMSLGELAQKVDITMANLSILKNNKARAVRFSTLEAICKALDCQPGDILEFVPDGEEDR